MTITFQFLRDLQKKERESKTLQEIPNNFYEEVSKYLNKKMKKSSLGSIEYQSTLPVIKFIFERREQKIINSALRFVRSKEQKKPKNMNKREEKFFDALTNLISENHISIDKLIADSEKEEAKEQEEPVEKKTNEKDFIKIEVLEDIPEFVADDLETYGPWSAREKVVAPRQAADILISSGKARMLD